MYDDHKCSSGDLVLIYSIHFCVFKADLVLTLLVLLRDLSGSERQRCLVTTVMLMSYKQQIKDFV